MSLSINSNAISSWATSLFSKLDTKNQGYIEKSDLQSAFDKIAESSGTGDDINVDELFSQLDADSDGKVTESELSTAMQKVSDELDTQYYQTRMQGGMLPPPGGNQEASSTESGDSTYIAAADTNGDGTVSAEELAIYYSSSETSSASDSDLQTMMSAMGGMPPPPPPTSTKGADAGFTKDELTSQLEEIGATDRTRSTLISGIIDNFEAADSDGDGKVNMEEAMAYDQNNNISGTSQTESATSSDSSLKVEMTIVKLLQAYGLEQSESSTNQISLVA